MNDYITFPREQFYRWWGQTQIGGTRYEITCPDPVDDLQERIAALEAENAKKEQLLQAAVSREIQYKTENAKLRKAIQNWLDLKWERDEGARPTPEMLGRIKAANEQLAEALASTEASDG